MHCLEVIIARNAYAAGKEAGEAIRNNDRALAQRIAVATQGAPSAPFAHGLDVGANDDPQYIAPLFARECGCERCAEALGGQR
jgi:hypothetical protein